ncbi:MAG: ABC transporter ATP-binding protein [Thermoplasmatales archaeon]|nr:MAG: ABC transporter ATP-binding protein [Thermoplasmatales archaeon]
MIKQTLMCPNCKNKVTIQGVPGEKISITCPKCNNLGVFTFPQEKTKDKSYMIKVNNLTKIYDGLKAVDNVSFKINRGEIFGFLGPNGAGKTTTIQAILGLIQVNSGEIKINGLSISKKGKEAKKHVGYLPEKVAFYDNLTALQNLNFYAEMKNASKDECKPLIHEFGLSEAVDKKVGKFSKGMIQRLGMARAVLGNPTILILDEPSGGLDPRGVVLIREKIREMRDKGATIFVSSHILSEIQEVCDRVGIINNGVLVAKDSVSELSTKLNLKPVISVELEKMLDAVAESVKKVKGVEKVEIKGKNIDIICEPKTKSKVIVAIEKAGGNIVNLKTKEPSLEEVFMRYTGG